MSAPGRTVRAGCGALLALVVLVVTVVAPAAAPRRSTVVLILPDVPDGDLSEAYVRMQAELRAAGFEVTPAASRRDLEPARALAAVAQERRATAVIAIFENPAGALEFWLLDARSGRTALKRLPRGGDPERAPEILAISAVELLLASLLELDIKAATDAEPLAPAPTKRARPSAVAERPPPRWGVELGVGAAVGVDRAGVAWLPAARLQWAPLPLLRARLSGLGLGSHPEITSPAGVARTSQAVLLTEVVLRPWSKARLAPQLSLGSGAYYFKIEGRSTQGELGVTAARWSAAVDAGVGLSWRQHRHLELVLEAHALLAQPYPSIRFFGTEQATAGRPTLIFSAMVAGWL